MWCIESHRSATGSFYARVLQLSWGKENNIRYSSQKKLLVSLFLLTLGLAVVLLNFHIAVSSFSKLFADGIENNPAPNNYCIERALRETCHQGNEKFRETAGM